MANYFLLSLSMIFLIGCAAPSPIFKITPAEEINDWNKGIGYIAKESDSIIFRVGHLGYEADGVHFNVSIENKTKEPIYINPAFFECCIHDTISIDSAILNPPINCVQAFDPETLITQISFQIEKDKTERSNAQTAKFVGRLFLGILNIIGSFVRSEPPTDEEIAENNRRAEERRSEDIREDEEFQNHIQRLKQRIDFWERYALRKHTIYPNELISGEIVFPLPKKVSLLQIRYPIGISCLDFWFIQKIILPSN